MAWTLRISDTAKRQLKKLDRSTAQALLRYLNRLLLEAENLRQRGKALTANLAGLWRYRVGDLTPKVGSRRLPPCFSA